MLPVGTPAPRFTLRDQDDTDVSLHEVAGKYTLIYFYPKDDTPGCTKEACTIAEVYDEFAKLGVTVLGISKDTPASHKKFAQKYSLPFRLLSDTDGSVLEAYKALGKKSMFGRSFVGIARISYLLDSTHTIVRTYQNVDPATHALEILTDIKHLQKNAS